MNRAARNFVRVALVGLLLRFLAAEIAQAQTMQSAIPTAAQRFKNIQVLKDMPADRLFPAMNFIAASLNVDCSFCHVDGPDFYKDDKKTKQTARQMMRMELAINQANFSNETIVTCNTCHRGSTNPIGSPVLQTEQPKNSGPETSLPPASAIIAKYVQALGSAGTIQKIESMVEKGSYTSNIFPGAFGFEAFAKAPRLRIEVVHYPEGDSLTAYNNNTGWTKGSGASQPMSESGADYLSYFADMYSAIHLQRMFTEFKAGPPEMVDGHDANVLIGLERGQMPSTFYFDKRSGLLLRMLRYSKTPLGPNPVLVKYEDYRPIAGTKVPFRRTFVQFGSQYTIQLQQVLVNTAIDDSKFTQLQVSH